MYDSPQFAYVVFNIYQLSTSLGLGTDPLQMVRNFKASRVEQQVPLLLAQSTSAVLDRLVDAVEHSLYVLSAATEVLPTTVIVSLVYRLMVLYSAIRVLPRLNAHSAYDPRNDVLRRRRHQAWSERKLPEAHKAPAHNQDPRTSGVAASDHDGSGKLETLLLNAKEPGSEDERDVTAYMDQAQPTQPTQPTQSKARADSAPHAAPPPGGAARVRLDNEPRGSSVLKVLVTYSRFVLIAVYSHLLLLDQNHQVYWRLMTVFFTLGLWSVELLLSKEESYLVSMYE